MLYTTKSLRFLTTFLKSRLHDSAVRMFTAQLLSLLGQKRVFFIFTEFIYAYSLFVNDNIPNKLIITILDESLSGLLRSYFLQVLNFNWCLLGNRMITYDLTFDIALVRMFDCYGFLKILLLLESFNL